MSELEVPIIINIIISIIIISIIVKFMKVYDRTMQQMTFERKIIVYESIIVPLPMKQRIGSGGRRKSLCGSKLFRSVNLLIYELFIYYWKTRMTMMNCYHQDRWNVSSWTIFSSSSSSYFYHFCVWIHQHHHWYWYLWSRW